MSKTESWGSRIGLILAMAGNAVGLGNFIRFPVQAVQNGGGSFMIPYLVCFFLMGIPLLLMEWSIGRYGGKFGKHSPPYIMGSIGKGLWKYLGALGVFSNLTLLGYYCYIESWTLAYVFHSLKGTFIDMPKEAVAGFFENYLDVSSVTSQALTFYILCVAINIYIVSKGIAGIEKFSKIAMPVLVFFGIILAIRGFTLGTSGASAEVPSASAWDGFNFLWTPTYQSIWDPKVWLAAAGQVFFTLAIGSATIHCYASYLSEKDDIVLNSFSTAFMNEFIEIIIGGAIVIPIAAGYLGIGWVKENAGFGMAFQTMPYLFQQWGPVLAAIGGLLWFGLLFFSGITSSLAIGMPWISFMNDAFGWDKQIGAYTLGIISLIMGLPTVIFYEYGVFDDFDYWIGTVCLVVFALLETLLFVFVFGIDRAWASIVMGADIKLFKIYKYIIQYVTPVFLIVIFASALITPKNNDWLGQIKAIGRGEVWKLDNNSIIKKIDNAEIKGKIRDTQNFEQKRKLEKTLDCINYSRILLALLLIFVFFLTYLSNNKTIISRKT